MIAIIAEKPSVGQDIARVIGATEKKDGYMAGNGYLVTWALGHLVSLAMPSAYGYGKASHEDLPMLPEPFQLVVRQIKTDRGMVTDVGAARQLKVIDEVFSKCDSIIVATDAGREGELIFRYIYHYLGYTKPFERLWISSLTDEAIRAGMNNLKDGKAYDSIYHAADCRAKADWLVGMNASRALALASGMPNNSLGRVQTPTLAMICSRYKENRDFVSTPYWQLHITLERPGEFRQFAHIEDFKSKEQAEVAHARFSPDSTALITKVERKRTYQQAPLLYDLTTLQKDCNTHHDMSADKTLAVAQALYEKKYISYPRTGSRYIPHDLMEQVYDSLWKIATMPEFKEYGKRFDFEHLNMRSVNDDKMTDHHALIITGIESEELNAHGLIASPLHFWLPPFIADRLAKGFRQFGRNARGFLTNDAVMIAVETRTSAPVRIIRECDTLQHIRLRGLFPCGEGAGYAGDIVSAGIDGNGVPKRRLNTAACSKSK